MSTSTRRWCGRSGSGTRGYWRERKAMSDLNGVAHVILTAGDFVRSTAFWRDVIRYLELKLVLDNDAMLYGVGGRTAIGIRTGSPGNAGQRFDQGAPGLHHACFRMRDRDAVDRLYAFLDRKSTRLNSSH